MPMVEQALVEHPKDPTGQDFIIRASAYPLCYQKEGWDGSTLARILEEYYDQVKPIGQNWVRLGLWSQYPTIGKLETGQVVPIKEIVTFLYLSPRTTLIDTLDIFRVIDNRGESYAWDDMEYGLRGIVGGRFEYNTEVERESGIPIFAVMWDEQDPVETRPSRNVINPRNRPWSSIPEDLRQRIEAGFLSFSIQCDYQTPEGINLKGVQFYQDSIDLYIQNSSLPIEPYAPSDEAELLLVSSVGRILGLLYTEGASALFKRD